MPLVTVKTPVVAKKLFPNYVWNMPRTEKNIYLTFDDGPTPKITNWTLDILKQYKAKASFFCIGNNIEKHSEIFQNILNNGHAIGNHTHNHIKGWKTKAEDYLTNIDLCESVLKSQVVSSEIANQNSLIVNLFRPPYGQITPKQGKKLMALGYKIIMWDILSFDWDKSVSPEQCLDNVLKKASNGSIIVFHDSLKASKNMQYALPKVLEHFTKKGYFFKSLNTI